MVCWIYRVGGTVDACTVVTSIPVVVCVLDNYQLLGVSGVPAANVM